MSFRPQKLLRKSDPKFCQVSKKFGTRSSVEIINFQIIKKLLLVSCCFLRLMHPKEVVFGKEGFLITLLNTSYPYPHQSRSDLPFQ